MDNLVILAAHPDDVACCVGGTLLQLKGHVQSHVLCATRGERGVPGQSFEETAVVREAEERAACKLLGAEVTFLDRINGDLDANRQICDEVAGIIRELQPVALMTLWAIDRHPDHSAVSEIARKAVGLGEEVCPVLYYEAAISCQASQFRPDVYVDVTDVMDAKLEVVRCHACQNVDEKLEDFTVKQSTYRGWECGAEYAEAFKTTRPVKMTPADLLGHLAKTKKKYPKF